VFLLHCGQIKVKSLTDLEKTLRIPLVISTCKFVKNLLTSPTLQTMGSNNDAIEVRGVVEELLPGAKFRVVIESGQEVTAHLAGKLRRFRIRILPGDEVKVELSPYDLSKGRLTYRF